MTEQPVPRRESIGASGDFLDRPGSRLFFFVHDRLIDQAAVGGPDELGEDAVGLDQLGVGAGLDDPAVVEDEDAIGVEQRGQAVGDEDHGAVGPGRVDRLLDRSAR